ncbi:MAG: hypothetical protein H0U44_03365 [Flavisolibacter sp.]|jgi:hypothetical protein|nr:hypothetical protein [Flavisolibacter sp.]
MNTNTFFGFVASLAFFVPVTIILYYRLYKHRSLLALMTSYLLTAFYNILSQDYLQVPPGFIRGFGVINNYLDIPLMLTALLFFCPIKKKQNSVHIVTAAFIIYEMILAFTFGLDPKVIIYIMGPGLAIIVGYTFYLFVRHIKITIVYGKNAGRTLMLVSILFAYGCYSLVYYFFYIQKTSDVADAFLLYFISSLAASILMSIGLHLIKKRMKQLQEIQNTRKELQLFFNH